jgi:hypothetical protein
MVVCHPDLLACALSRFRPRQCPQFSAFDGQISTDLQKAKIDDVGRRVPTERATRQGRPFALSGGGIGRGAPAKHCPEGVSPFTSSTFEKTTYSTANQQSGTSSEDAPVPYRISFSRQMRYPVTVFPLYLNPSIPASMLLPNSDPFCAKRRKHASSQSDQKPPACAFPTSQEEQPCHSIFDGKNSSNGYTISCGSFS